MAKKKKTTGQTKTVTNTAVPSQGSSLCDRISLHEATFKGYEECVKKKLEQGENPNVRDELGRTPLHLAAQAGNYHIAKLLLEHKADPNARDASGQTPLHWAVAMGHVDIIELLLEYGANPNIQDYAGNTPLHIAAMSKYFSDVAEVMFEAAPRILGPAGFPYERRDVVRLLLEYGADPTIENNLGMTPLEMAIKYDNEEATELIAARTPPEHKKRLLKRRNEAYA